MLTSARPKRGDVRGDGRIFWGWVKRNGKLHQKWYCRETFDRQRRLVVGGRQAYGLSDKIQRMNGEMTLLPQHHAVEMASKIEGVKPIAMAYMGSNTVFFGEYKTGSRFAAIAHRNGTGGQVVVNLENLEQMVTLLKG